MADRSDPLGYDLDVGPRASGRVDMYPDGRTCSGVTLVENEMIARLMVDRMRMSGTADGWTEFGEDQRQHVGSPGPLNDTMIAIILGRSERIWSGSVRVESQRQAIGAHYTFTVQITATCVDGSQVDLILGINDATVERIAKV